MPRIRGQGVVDDDIHLGVLAQHLLPGDVAHEVVALLLVNHIHYGSLLAKLIGNASANATGTASHDDNSVFECICLHHLILLYHQHYPPLGLCKSVWIATNHGIHLIGGDGLPILADVQAVAVDHLRNLLRPQPSVLAGEAVEYGFFNFHNSKVTRFYRHSAKSGAKNEIIHRTWCIFARRNNYLFGNEKTK